MLRIHYYVTGVCDEDRLLQRYVGQREVGLLRAPDHSARLLHRGAAEVRLDVALAMARRPELLVAVRTVERPRAWWTVGEGATSEQALNKCV